MKTAVCSALLLTLLSACGPSPSQKSSQPPSDPEVVAIFDGGQLTKLDLDQAIIALPAEFRQPAAEQSMPQWYEGILRELALDRLLEQEPAFEFAAEDPDVARAIQEARRQAVIEIFLERNPAANDDITVDDARRYYEQHPELYDRPERRLVSHVFKQRIDGESLENLKRDMSALRERIVAGESFSALASEHSDSESRHRQGKLGWVGRDQLAPQLASVIFSLPEGEPSDLLTTADGIHIFRVDKAVEAKKFDFEEVERAITALLRQQQGQAAFDELAGQLPTPPGSFVVASEDLADLLAGGDPNEVLLRVEDFEVTVQRFRGMVANNLRQLGPGQSPPEDFPQQFLRQLEQRQRVYGHAVSLGFLDDPQVKKRFAVSDRQILLTHARQTSLQSFLTQQPERLQEFYENNKLRFSSPLRFQLRLLAVPVTSESAPSAMAFLERLAAEQEQATDRLAQAAAELDGEVEELGWLTMPELAGVDQRWPPVVADLTPGQLSAPLFSTTVVALLEVIDRQDPEALPFATVIERVRASYLQNNRHELYRDWTADQLDRANFQVFSGRLEDLSLGLPSTEVASDE